LTRNPIRCRVCSDIDPDEVSAVEADDHEGVEQANLTESEGRTLRGRESTI
jgi:hypothetical protein